MYIMFSSIAANELDQVVGGRGQFIETRTIHNRLGTFTLTYTNTCDIAPDDQTFTMRYNQWPTDCPDYVWKGRGASQGWCISCAHYQSSMFAPR